MINIPGTVAQKTRSRDDVSSGRRSVRAEYPRRKPGVHGSAYAGWAEARYYFQVFALDSAIPQDASATYAAMADAMKDHVLREREVIGLGQVAPPATPPHN